MGKVCFDKGDGRSRFVGGLEAFHTRYRARWAGEGAGLSGAREIRDSHGHEVQILKLKEGKFMFFSTSLALIGI